MGCEASTVALRHADYWEPVSGWNMPRQALNARLAPQEMEHAEEAVRQRRPVVAGERSGTVPVAGAWAGRASLAVPLVVAGSIPGCLLFAYYSAPHVFSDAEVEFARRCGEAMSSALQNARLYEVERHSSSLLHAVLSFSPLLQNAATVTDVAAAVCQRAQELFECDGVALFEVAGDELKLSLCLPEVPSPQLGERFAAAAPGDARGVLGGPVAIADAGAAGTAPAVRELARALRLRGVLRLPIAAGARPLGLVVLGWHAAPPPGEGLLAAARRFADQAGAGLGERRAARGPGRGGAAARSP